MTGDAQLADDIFSDIEPTSLGLDGRLLSVVTHKLGLTRLTKIQADSFRPIVDGSDVLMRADTGSGKTLSYLVPIMQRLVTDFPKDTNPIHRKMGPLVVIISPTRELCLQISTVLDAFRSQMPYLTPGTLIGGEKMEAEKRRIRNGITVLVATPGRILYHLQNS
jgi:ATP-dependent RNA helicase DDX31/DBP7